MLWGRDKKGAESPRLVVYVLSYCAFSAEGA